MTPNINGPHVKPGWIRRVEERRALERKLIRDRRERWILLGVSLLMVLFGVLLWCIR